MRPEVERHIAAMRIVMARNCTLQEANAEVDALRARAAREAVEQWRSNLGKRRATPQLDRAAPSEPWMMRD